jgi:hypothetical protein
MRKVLVKDLKLGQKIKHNDTVGEVILADRLDMVFPFAMGYGVPPSFDKSLGQRISFDGMYIASSNINNVHFYKWMGSDNEVELLDEQTNILNGGVIL